MAPPQHARVPRSGHDRGEIVLGWLTRVVVVLGLLGVLAIDLGSIGWNRMAVADAASQVARAGAQAIAGSARVVPTAVWRRAWDAASAEAVRVGVVLAPDQLTVSADASVTAHVTDTAPTIVLGRLPWLRDLPQAEATATARDSA
ncbi:MAG: hypothetical protein EPO13_05155 [Actinomycetota bacterium]|nr:MAG: hypothetical protein EPO13_05155 [Actinomycetota bacterium]